MKNKGIQSNINNSKYLLDKNYNLECNKLINDIKSAILEIEEARNVFNNVSEAHLIEIAIYAENVAKKRYEYLLSIAKKRGIRVGGAYIIKNNLIRFEQ